MAKKMSGETGFEYVRKMFEISKKSGKTAKVPNPSNGKLVDIKPKPAAKKSVSGKTVKATPKPATKKTSNGSDTKPFNVRLIKPEEIIRDKFKTKPAPKKTEPKGPKLSKTVVKKKAK